MSDTYGKIIKILENTPSDSRFWNDKKRKNCSDLIKEIRKINHSKMSSDQSEREQ